MRSIITAEELNQWRQSQERDGKTVGFVATMGALHEGHLSLVKEAKRQCTSVIVSIFVNPTQFGPNEDFSKYPRTLKDDLALLNEAGVDAVFTPLAQEIYPEGFSTFVSNEAKSNILCGASRPGHFRGVLTVVMKLFHLVKPHEAFFGQKDYQQVFLIKQMVQDLSMGISVRSCAIQREAHGLAMSSRNRYLTPEERDQAATIYATMQDVATKLEMGKIQPEHIHDTFQTALAAAGMTLEYATLRRRDNLDAAAAFQRGSQVLLVACKLGHTRLIDNLEC